MNQIYTISCIPDSYTRRAHYLGAFSSYELAKKELKGVNSSTCGKVNWIYKIVKTDEKLLFALDGALPKYFPYRD